MRSDRRQREQGMRDERWSVGHGMKTRWPAEDTILDDVDSVRRRIAQRRVAEHDQVSEASEESFPASDAPSWTTSTASIAATVTPSRPFE